MHPSLLPHYRGPAPIQHALLNGERETGVCVIEMLNMKAGPVDSGDVWGSEKTVSKLNSLNSPSLQGRLANLRWNYVWPITGQSGETRRPTSGLRAPADVTFNSLSPRFFLFSFPLILFPQGRGGTTEGSRRIENGAHDLGCGQLRGSKVANRGSDCPNLPCPRGQTPTPTQLNTVSLNRPVLETSGP